MTDQLISKDTWLHRVKAAGLAIRFSANRAYAIDKNGHTQGFLCTITNLGWLHLDTQ